MSIPGTPQALANSSTTIFMGTTLKLDVDQSSSTLELVELDGSHIDLWGKTLQYAFAPQQTMVTLYFTPVDGSDAITASYVNGQGTTVHSTQQSGSAVLTIQRPPNSGVSFEIELDQGTASFASAMSAPAASVPAASAPLAARVVAPTPSIDLRPSPTLATSKPSGLVSSSSTSPAPKPSGPGARLQTRLVLTTVEPPPDPDARPITAAG
jgi:hypothetical protein